jgi:hypothetical protein
MQPLTPTLSRGERGEREKALLQLSELALLSHTLNPAL